MTIAAITAASISSGAMAATPSSVSMMAISTGTPRPSASIAQNMLVFHAILKSM